MFKDIYEVNDWIYQHSPINQLDRFQQFLAVLDHPQNQLNTIHVAGTNGKGSTVTYLSSILQEANYKVGTLTTPYLHVLNDRIKVNNQMIPDSFIIDTIQRYHELIEEYHLSYHEIDMFLATLFFIDQGVDIAIYEVGLGGSRDATNVITPLVSVITNIGKDHMAYLGDTYEKIAYEKAGIIKENVPLFTMETKEECLAVFKEKCHTCHAPFIQVKEKDYKEKDHHLTFKTEMSWIDLQTLAKYQIKNASLVYEVVLYLRNERNLLIFDEAIKNGFWKAFWPGRFEMIHQDPLIILDGAHNLEGIEAFMDSAKGYKDACILFSALKDKEVDTMITRLLELSYPLIVTSFIDERIAPLKEIALHHHLTYFEDFREIIDKVLEKDQTIFVVGSLHFISKVRAYVFDKKGESTNSRSMYGKSFYRN